MIRLLGSGLVSRNTLLNHKKQERLGKIRASRYLVFARASSPSRPFQIPSSLKLSISSTTSLTNLIGSPPTASIMFLKDPSYFFRAKGKAGRQDVIDMSIIEGDDPTDLTKNLPRIPHPNNPFLNQRHRFHHIGTSPRRVLLRFVVLPSTSKYPSELFVRQRAIPLPTSLGRCNRYPGSLGWSPGLQVRP